MGDSYQAIYDAVRSRISNGDIGNVIERVALECFDISNVLPHMQQEIYTTSHEWQRPSVLYRPTLSADGSEWMALLGENLQEGVAGFGKTPAEAMAAFDAAFWNERTPAARRALADKETPREGKGRVG